MTVTIDDVWGAWDALRGLGADPFITTVVVGIIWPWIQAALDRPWWTRARRATLVAAVSVLVALVVWLVSAYPFAWQQIAAQASVFLGIAWVVYQALAGVTVRGVRLLDWVGAVTPGGQSAEQVRAVSAPVASGADFVATEIEGDAAGRVEPVWRPVSGGDGESRVG